MWNLSLIVGFVGILCLHGATIRPRIDGIPVGLMSRRNIENLNNFVGRPRPTPPQTVPDNRDQNSDLNGAKNVDNNKDLSLVPIRGDMLFPAPEQVTFGPPDIVTSSTKRPTVLRGDITFEIPVFPWSTTTEGSITTTENTKTTVPTTVPPTTVTDTTMATDNPVTTDSTTETPTLTTTDNIPTTESGSTTTEADVTTTQDIPTTTDLLTTTTHATTETPHITIVEPTQSSSSTVVTSTTTTSTSSTPETVTVTTKTVPVTTEVKTTTQEITTTTTEPTTQTTSVPVISTITPPTSDKPPSTSTSMPTTTSSTSVPSVPPTTGNISIIPDRDFDDFLDFGDDSDDSDDSDDDDDLEDFDDLGFWLGDDGEDDFNWWNGLFGARVSDNFKLSARPRTEEAIVSEVRDMKSMPTRNQEENEKIASRIDNLLDTLYFNSKNWLYVVNEGGLPQKRKLLMKFDSFMNSVYKRLSNKFLKSVNHSNGQKKTLY